MKLLQTAFILFCLFLVISPTCSTEDSPKEQKKAVIALPPPQKKGGMSLTECIDTRRSIRSYDDKALTMKELGQICWAAQGITGKDRPFRSAPSAGALYPLELYAVTAEGLFRYIPKNHALEVVTTKNLRDPFLNACMKQACVRQAPVVLVFAAVFQRITRKYGEERAWRYIDIEVGHAAQNVALQAVALGLGTVDVGGFSDEKVKKALSLPEDHEPRLVLSVGHPKR